MSLPYFEKKPTFDRIQIPDEQRSSDKSSISKAEKVKLRRPLQKPSRTQASRDANTVSEKEINYKKHTISIGKELNSKDNQANFKKTEWNKEYY